MVEEQGEPLGTWKGLAFSFTKRRAWWAHVTDGKLKFIIKAKGRTDSKAREGGRDTSLLSGNRPLQGLEEYLFLLCILIYLTIHQG